MKLPYMTPLLGFAFTFAALSLAGPQAQGALLISDNFETADSGLTDNNDLAARQAGSLAPTNWTNAKAAHQIVNGNVQSNEGSTTSGRAYFNRNFIDTAITDAGGFIVEYDFISGNTNTGDWIMLGLGLAGGSGGTQSNNSNLAGIVDFGLLLQGNGNFQVFQGGSQATGGIAMPSIVQGEENAVELTIATSSFAGGSTATVTATVNGTAIDLNGGDPGTDLTYAWDNEVENRIVWESNQTVHAFDNVAISTIPEPGSAALMLSGAAMLLLRSRRTTAE